MLIRILGIILLIMVMVMLGIMALFGGMVGYYCIIAMSVLMVISFVIILAEAFFQ